MFTGIVEELGELVAARRGATTHLQFTAGRIAASVSVGESVAVNGCCLTVVERDRSSFGIDAVDETLSRTNLGQLEVGERVNLERAVALGGRLDGHLVQGHVDATGTVVEAAPHLAIEVPDRLERYLVEKGSIALDGCSLTIVAVASRLVRVEIVPYTAAVTTLGWKGGGSLVNVEVDVVAKYVERLVRAGAPSPYRGTEGES